MKRATIQDQDDESFRLEYDNSRGTTSTMRLEASTYEGAIEEARAYLGLKDDDHDAEGVQWLVE